MKIITYILLIISIVTKCASQKTIDESHNVLNSYLAKESSNLLLEKENYFNGSTLGYFGMYSKWYKAEQKTKDLDFSLSGNVEWIFTDDDIDYMKEKYNEWISGNWDKTKVIEKVSLIDGKSNSYSMQQTIKISYPFFDKTMTKAIIVVSKSTSSLNGGINIILMKKDNGVWIKVGSLMYSIS